MSTTKAKLDRALTWRYLLALSLVACLSTGAFLALYLTLSAQEQQAGLIREVAKQQAASQRVAFLPMPMPLRRTGSIGRTITASSGAAFAPWSARISA